MDSCEMCLAVRASVDAFPREVSSICEAHTISEFGGESGVRGFELWVVAICERYWPWKVVCVFRRRLAEVDLLGGGLSGID